MKNRNNILYTYLEERNQLRLHTLLTAIGGILIIITIIVVFYFGSI